MIDLRAETGYFYCPDYDAYVKCQDLIFYVIKNGKEVMNDFYSKILMSEIYYEDISEEKYKAQLY